MPVFSAVGLTNPPQLDNLMVDNPASKVAQWACEQTEASGGLTWLRGDEMVALDQGWRNVLPA